MTKHDRERQERLIALLREKKQTLWSELREELFRKTGEGLQSQYELPQDLGDRGMIDLLADMGLALADIHQEELTRMEEAERKLREGTYGRCEECGREIDEKRLALLPFTPCCVSCQTRREGPATPPGVTL
ncbi:molecular chaperone DnaK [Geotalea uraniireducens]|uniref:Molecular chaperone DnaK n=1 Tax=Geotalea uraniireducens TaxID=351604 RepID=A0ABM8ELA6_9BACT|nr:TraR/DksA family transcriptional regulator [Geotalea uraniireducens]BDV42994.1 molecular chaperone DnaK [Geotalea uraniireducens]